MEKYMENCNEKLNRHEHRLRKDHNNFYFAYFIMRKTVEKRVAGGKILAILFIRLFHKPQ